MLPLIASLFASAFATVSVSAQVPPRCGLVARSDMVEAQCNAPHWSVVAAGADGREAVVWQAPGPGSTILPASPGATYRLVVDY